MQEELVREVIIKVLILILQNENIFDFMVISEKNVVISICLLWVLEDKVRQGERRNKELMFYIDVVLENFIVFLEITMFEIKVNVRCYN